MVRGGGRRRTSDDDDGKMSKPIFSETVSVDRITI